MYNCRILHIKKPGELNDSHSTNKFSLDLTRTFIIVDDFIATGNTINSIYRNLIENDFPRDKQIDILCVTDNPKLKNLNFKPKYIICGEIPFNLCKECGGEVNQESQAYTNTIVSSKDFGHEEGLLEPGTTLNEGYAELTNCYKCKDCGHSFTVN